MAGHAGSAAALRTSKSRALGLGLVGVMLGAWLASPVLAAKPAGEPAAPDAPIPRATAAIESRPATTVPAGKSAAPSISPQLAEAERLKRLNAAKSW